MKLRRNGNKETAFKLQDIAYIQSSRMIVSSDFVFSKAGWKVDYDAKLNGSALEITVNNIVPPQGVATHSIMPASSDVVISYTPSPVISYDNATKTLTGPAGSKLDIILKDDFKNKGKEDKYECIL